MNIVNICPTGKRVLQNKGAVIIGISLDNSYFNTQNIENLLSWAYHTTGTFYVMIPDEPAIYTMMAKGFTKEKACTKARLKGNCLENKCRKIGAKLSIPITIMRWNSFSETVSYKMSLHMINTLYETDTLFQQMVRKTTKEVLINDAEKVLEKNIDTGVHFVLQELAFISNARQILEESHIAYVYHKTMPVLQYVLDKHTLLQHGEVGCITLVNEP